ncbi:ABC transporter substrate-binding protein [Halorarius litoreus]|uniref:ABC transporter substrate-binding protein n=1 Tax=Halorarius litoreus TaxID=2962676 RepID=UPI0020CB9B9E|nr:ABC transporter substrate-binding protein [Halorarius litoreus]
MRVVTLLPSATEIVYALGVEPVATSHECDWPPEAQDKPAVNYANVDPDSSPSDINEQVVEAEQGEGVYGIDLDALERADPDVVVSQGVCDVCAVDSVLVEDAVAELGLDCDVVTTDAHSIEDMLEDVERLGRVLHREQEAEAVVAGLRERIDSVTERAKDATDSPRVAVLDWTDPVMVAGHWVPGMVESLGAEYGLEQAGHDSRPREWNEISEYDPEVLVAAPCGFGLDQTVENLADLTERDGWRDLTAVATERAYAMDGHHYVNRPGPRLVDTLEYLAGLVHPDVFEAPPESVARPLARQVA